MGAKPSELLGATELLKEAKHYLRARSQLLYFNIVGQNPSQSEADFYQNFMRENNWDGGGLARFAADVGLNLDNINFIGLVDTGVAFI